MRMQITVDEKTKEVVERLARIVGVSQSCVFSYGITRICHEINTNEDNLFESLYDYTENYYKVHNKQGGRNEKKTTLEKKSQDLSDSWRLSSLGDICQNHDNNCDYCDFADKCPGQLLKVE